MNRIALICAVGVACCVWAVAGTSSPKELRVLIVTGGHDFDRKGFNALWASMPGLSVREVTHPDAHQWFALDRARQYDVMVWYDMHQDIAEGSRENLVKMLKRGKGLVVLHHALADYQDWNEAEAIIGGRFRLRETERDGAKRPPSTAKDDVAFRVTVADRKHPVTKGVEDFDIVDETYGDYDVLPTSKPLLTTDEPTSARVLAWWHEYGRSRVVTIQSGHGPSAWENPSFRRLLEQAVRWSVGRLR